jgi:hypothetical protein
MHFSLLLLFFFHTVYFCTLLFVSIDEMNFLNIPHPLIFENLLYWKVGTCQYPYDAFCPHKEKHQSTE